MFRKNVAGQFIHFQGVDTATGGIKSGVTWTARRCLDGTFAAATGTATEDGTTGWYKFALSQADTNGNNCAINFTGTGAVPQTVNFVTTALDPTSTAFGLSIAKTTNITGFNDIAATAIVSSGAITTSGGAVSTVTNTTQLNGAATVVLTDASSDAVIADAVWNAATASYGTANTYGALIESGNVGGGAIVAASVTGAVGSVTGAVGSVTGAVGSVTGNVGGNVTGSVGSVTGLTNATIADAVWDEAQADHVTAGSFGITASEIADILVDTAEIGAAGAGLTAINLPDQTMNITGNITGNLSGSVGSVTGAVGSVTGAVGSVTGLTVADVAAIKAKTDSLTFTVAGQVDANAQSINDVTIVGDGSATPFNV